VTINGSGFVGLPAVRFGGAQTFPTSVSRTALVVLVPKDASTGFVTVSTTEGLGNSSTRFTLIQTPTLTLFTPSRGAAGTSVLLTGEQPDQHEHRAVQRIAATTTSPNASVTTALRAVVPTGATTGRITVTNEAGP